MYRALAKVRLQDAIEPTIFMCGKSPLDPDDPCYDIFKCDPSMDCDTRVESEYYASKIMPQDIPMYCHCASTSESPITMHSHLMAQNGGPYYIVLHICEVCIASGYHILVRGTRQNAEAKQAKIDAKKARDVARLEEATATAQANAMDAQASASAKSGAHPQPKKSRKRKVPDNNLPGTRSTSSKISKGGRGGRGARWWRQRWQDSGREVVDACCFPCCVGALLSNFHFHLFHLHYPLHKYGTLSSKSMS